MRKTSKPIKDAPSRAVMPQTTEAKHTLDNTRVGTINYMRPFKLGGEVEDETKEFVEYWNDQPDSELVKLLHESHVPNLHKVIRSDKTIIDQGNGFFDVKEVVYKPGMDRSDLMDIIKSWDDEYKRGGSVEDLPTDVDLFEHYDLHPPKLKAMIEEFQHEYIDGADYNDLDKVKKEFEKIGFTFDYGLDAEPFNLRRIGTRGSEEYYKSGGKIPKGYRKELETEDFIYYIEKDGEHVIMITKSDGSIASDNYFAENDLYEKMVAIANGKEDYVYISPESKKYLNEFIETYKRGGKVKIYNVAVRKTSESPWEVVNKEPLTEDEADELMKDYKKSGIKHYALERHLDIGFSLGGLIIGAGLGVLGKSLYDKAKKTQQFLAVKEKRYTYTEDGKTKTMVLKQGEWFSGKLKSNAGGNYVFVTPDGKEMKVKQSDFVLSYMSGGKVNEIIDTMATENNKPNLSYAVGGEVEYANAENEAVGTFLLNSKDGKEILSKSKNSNELENHVRKYHSTKGIPNWEFEDDYDEGIDWVAFGDLFETIKNEYKKGGFLGFEKDFDNPQEVRDYYLGKKVRIIENIEDSFPEYQGQELTISKVFEDDYVEVTDGKKTWFVGIEETDLFNFRKGGKVHHNKNDYRHMSDEKHEIQYAIDAGLKSRKGYGGKNKRIKDYLLRGGDVGMAMTVKEQRDMAVKRLIGIQNMLLEVQEGAIPSDKALPMLIKLSDLSDPEPETWAMELEEFKTGGKVPKHNQKLDMMYQSREKWEENRKKPAKKHPRQMNKGGKISNKQDHKAIKEKLKKIGASDWIPHMHLHSETIVFDLPGIPYKNGIMYHELNKVKNFQEFTDTVGIISEAN
jgi:hypothetical protein